MKSEQLDRIAEKVAAKHPTMLPGIVREIIAEAHSELVLDAVFTPLEDGGTTQEWVCPRCETKVNSKLVNCPNCTSTGNFPPTSSPKNLLYAQPAHPCRHRLDATPQEQCFCDYGLTKLEAFTMAAMQGLLAADGKFKVDNQGISLCALGTAKATLDLLAKAQGIV